MRFGSRYLRFGLLTVLVLGLAVAFNSSMQSSYSSEAPLSSAEKARLEKATLAAG